MTLFDRLGGKTAVDAAVEHFYSKIVSDDRTKGLFASINMAYLKTMMKKFLRQATSEEKEYKGKNMYDVHKYVNNGNFPTEAQFDVVIELWMATLQELGVKDDIIGEVVDVMGTVKPAILGQTRPPDAEPAN